MTITNLYLPAIVELPSGRFVVCNEGWIPVPPEFTIEDVKKIWKSKDYTKPQDEDGVFEVLSSDGVKKYKVTIENGTYHCTCTGFGYRRKCVHVDKIKKEHGIQS